MTPNRRRRQPVVTIGSGRETKLGRRKPFRESRSVSLIVTNGVKTEKQYFAALRGEAWTQSFHVTAKNCAPVALVAHAASEKSTSDYDSVWCVCDVDEYDVKQAILDAEQFSVGLALSVPCFEVWLLLHLTDCRKAFHNASEVKRELLKHINDWDKTRLRFNDFREGIRLATERAKSLDSPPANPSTSVWEVLEALASMFRESGWVV